MALSHYPELELRVVASYNSQQLASCRVELALMSRYVVAMSPYVARTRQGAARTLNCLKFSLEFYSRVRVGEMS